MVNAYCLVTSNFVFFEVLRNENVFRVLRLTSLLLFDPVEMISFLNDCGKHLFKKIFFSALSVFPKHSFGRTVTPQFQPNFSLQKSIFARRNFLWHNGDFSRKYNCKKCFFLESEKCLTTYTIVSLFCSFFSRPFQERFNFLKNCLHNFHKNLHSHSTPKGALRAQMHQNRMTGI